MSDFKTYAVKRMKEHNDIVSMFFFKITFLNKNFIHLNLYFFNRSVSEEPSEFDEASSVQRLDNVNVSSLFVNLILYFLNNILIR